MSLPRTETFGSIWSVYSVQNVISGLVIYIGGSNDNYYTIISFSLEERKEIDN